MSKDEFDMVNSPPHYMQSGGAIECIDAIKSALGVEGFKAFCQGNAIKYLWRYEHKGKAAEDLRKAVWYIERLSAELETPWHEGNIEQEYNAIPDPIDDEPTAPHVPQNPEFPKVRNVCAFKGS
jgi:hypothetical protein